MKRKLLYCSALIPAMLACGASAQVVNFHGDYNYALYETPVVPAGYIYHELFAGQGAYPDPGNNIWNGFNSHTIGFQSTYWYSGPAGSGGLWPQQYGNPGNPYAFFGGTSSTGASLFSFSSGSPTGTGNANSAGQISPITISIANAAGDFGGVWYQNASTTPEVNGSPQFLSGSCILANGANPVLVTTLGNVPDGTYGLYIYNTTEYNDRGATWTLEAANGGFPHNGIATAVNEDNPDGVPDPNGFVEGGNFVIYENVVPDSSGNIVISGTAITNPHSGNSDETDLNGIQLIYNPLPTEVGLNKAANVYSGGTATFSFSPVFADEDTATPSYQWQFSNNGGSTWSDVGPDSPTYTIAGATTAKAGLYRCIITDNVTSAVGATPLASLSILTSTLPNLLQIGDIVTDVNNNGTFIGNAIPPPIFMTVSNIEDGTLYQYENFGVNGNTTTTGFTGPAGFIITPKFGGSIVTGIRIFTSGSHPEADPINYKLQGSTVGPSGPWTTLSSGSLALPLARNAAGGPVNLTNDALQEIDFANTQYAVSYQLTFNDVRSDLTDSNGVQVAEIQLLGVNGGPPVIVASPALLTEVPACPVGAPVTLSVGVTGSPTFSYEWFRNGSTVVQNGSSSNYTFDALEGTNTYDVIVSGSVSPPATSAVFTVVGSAGVVPPVLNLNDPTQWTLNAGGVYSSAPVILDGELELTDGGGGEMTSAFYNTLQYIGGFIASFDYIPSGSADGITFCLQNSEQGTNALGTSASGGGGGLGFDAISPAFAVELNIYTLANGGEGIAYGVNGSTPDSKTPAPSAPYNSTAPVDLTSGSPIYVQLYYMNGVLNVWLVDTGSLAEYTTNFAANLPAFAGGASAYVGFTGGDGGDTSTQVVTDFLFSSTTPPTLSIAAGSPGNVVISWPISVSSLFNLYQSSSVTGPWTPAGSPTVNGCESQVTVAASGTSQFFTLALDQPTQ
jgi:hypothetical protein